MSSRQFRPWCHKCIYSSHYVIFLTHITFIHHRLGGITSSYTCGVSPWLSCSSSWLYILTTSPHSLTSIPHCPLDLWGTRLKSWLDRFSFPSQNSMLLKVCFEYLLGTSQVSTVFPLILSIQILRSSNYTYGQWPQCFKDYCSILIVVEDHYT